MTNAPSSPLSNRSIAGSYPVLGGCIALTALLCACGSDGATPIDDADTAQSDASDDVVAVDVSTDVDADLDAVQTDTDSDTVIDDAGEDTVASDVVDADATDDASDTDTSTDVADVDLGDASEDTASDVSDVGDDSDLDTAIDANEDTADTDTGIECNYLDLGIFIVECVDTPTRIRRWSATNATDEECPPYFTVGIIPYDTYEEAIAGASCDDTCVWTQFQSVTLLYCDRRMGYIVWAAEGCDDLYEYSDGLYPSHEAYTEAHPCE